MSDVLDVTFEAHNGQSIRCAKNDAQVPPLPTQKSRDRATLPSALGKFLKERNRSEGLAKFEAALCKYVSSKLGTRMLAHVRLSATERAIGMPNEAPCYFEVRGILLPPIDVYCLEDLTQGPLPRNFRTWQRIIHSAADAAYGINKHGITMTDCAPRNYRFRGEMEMGWYRSGWHEKEGWNPDVEYWEQAETEDNPGANGVVMVNLVRRKTGMELPIMYPDWYGIMAGIRRRGGTLTTDNCAVSFRTPVHQYLYAILLTQQDGLQAGITGRGQCNQPKWLEW
ncbi:hypothetical protein N657DRAFT_652367 [Parathielavia appendiculata]|uniref:Uncharacterized protein n=1 Tax=Parathielavia appendiculata TaxID=2587402 RepID=A0AAN6Z8R0_9PEZI|nr:hypothetical protein N657DRAFT_652367 [Parathielavia appendiculata]